MNKIKYLYSILFVAVLFSSCVKNADHFTDFSQADAILELKTSIATGASANTVNIAGLGNFSSSSLSAIQSYFADTISFYVNLASNNTLNKDLHVKVGVNQAARDAYNSSQPTGALTYEALPDSTYSWTEQTVTIPAGQRVVLVSGLIFHYDKMDPTKNYMLPIGIVDGDGVNVSANQGAIYFHSIGNPNAGSYTVTGTRTNYNGSSSSGDVTGVTNLANFSPKTATPESPTIIDIDYANLAPSHYVITFNAAGDQISDVTVDDDFLASITNFGVDVATYDAATKTIHIKTHYTNSAGNDRVVEEFFKRK